MTSLLAPLADPGQQIDTSAVDEADRRPAGQVGWDRPAATSVLLALLVWAIPLTHGTGGRAPWVLATALVSLLPGLVLVRPWRALSSVHLMVAAAPSVATIAVCVTAPTGWDGLDELATWTYAGGLYVVVRSWATTPTRRRAVLLGLCLAGLEQFTQAYLPWWGSGSTATMMTGTFYWHNQFAAFILGTGLVGGVLAVRGHGVLRLVGWLSAPWCLAALLFAASRATIATFVLCWGLVVGLSFLDRRGRVASLGLIVVTLGLASLLASPVLMEDGGAATGTLSARQQEQSVQGNGAARLELGRAAIAVGLEHPLTGAGFDSFAGASATHMSPWQTLSPYVHNGYLQAFNDGGIVLVMTVAAATLAPVAAGLVRAARRRREDSVVAVAAPVALTSLLLHSGADFDWVYPSLLGLFAVLAAMVTPAGSQDARVGARAAAFVVLASLVLVAVPAALRATVSSAPAAAVPAWVQVVGKAVPLRDPTPWGLTAVSECRAELRSDDPSTVRHGIRCARQASFDDPFLRLEVASALVRSGHERAGLQMAGHVMAVHRDQRPSLVTGYAVVLAQSGQRGPAVTELSRLREQYAERRDATHVTQLSVMIVKLSSHP